MKDFFQGCLMVAVALVAVVLGGAAILGGSAILMVILVPIAVVTAAWILVVCIGARISGGKVDLTFNVGKKAKQEEGESHERQGQLAHKS